LIKILAVSGSPVVNSSTDILLQRVAAAIAKELGGAEAEISFVKLNSLSFRGCQSCGVDPTPRWCFYDDLGDILDQLAVCDCLLFGSPIYFDSVSAQAKAFIDRCNCFRPADFDEDSDGGFIRRLKHTRPGAMVLVGGEREWLEGARRVIAGFFKWVEVDNQGLLTYSSPTNSKHGTAAEDSEAMARADELGAHLAGLLMKEIGEDK